MSGRKVGPQEWLRCAHAAGLPDTHLRVMEAIAAVSDEQGNWNTDDLEDYLELPRGSLRSAL